MQLDSNIASNKNLLLHEDTNFKCQHYTPQNEKKKREKKQTVNFLKRCSFKKCAQLPQCFVVSTQRQP